MNFLSDSIEDTIKIAEKFAKKLKVRDCIALIGELGSGKTVFTKGIAKGIGVRGARYVNSPTFVIIKEYKGKMPLYHFDLYRLNHCSSLDALSYDEYFYGDGVTVIEWADKIRKLLPKKYTEVRLTVSGENSRKIDVIKHR